MPNFTCLIVAHGPQGLAETLRCSQLAPEILVIHDAGSGELDQLCLRYRARSKALAPGATPGTYALDANHDWLLLLKAGEELSARMIAALEHWRDEKEDPCAGHLVTCDQTAQLRLVNRAMLNWIGELPPMPTAAGAVFPGAIVHRASHKAA